MNVPFLLLQISTPRVRSSNSILPLLLSPSILQAAAATPIDHHFVSREKSPGVFISTGGEWMDRRGKSTVRVGAQYTISSFSHFHERHYIFISPSCMACTGLFTIFFLSSLPLSVPETVTSPSCLLRYEDRSCQTGSVEMKRKKKKKKRFADHRSHCLKNSALPWTLIPPFLSKFSTFLPVKVLISVEWCTTLRNVQSQFQGSRAHASNFLLLISTRVRSLARSLVLRALSRSRPVACNVLLRPLINNCQ